MVDTVRTLSALQALLADNTAGDISAQDVRDFLVSVYPVTVIKTADETIQSSTTLQDDNELVMAVSANETWWFSLDLWYASGMGPDFKAALTAPAGATLWWVTPNYVNASAASWGNVAVEVSGASRSLVGGTGSRFVGIVGLLLVDATPGNLQLQWAQNTSDASDTTVFANSVLKAQRNPA